MRGNGKARLSRTGFVAGAVALAMVFCGSVAAAAPATVGNTDGQGLTVRAGTSTSSSPVGLAQTGDQVDVQCQAHGEKVTNTKGFSSDLWDFVPALDGYLADAYMDTGHDGAIPGVPECADGGGDSPGDYVLISQFQGQPNQGIDCGPTSVVTALLAYGKTPRGWDANAPVGAINQARTDMGGDPSYRDPADGGTNEEQVRMALDANGVAAEAIYGDLGALLSRVRDGHPVVLAGNLAGVPWDGSSVGHFLTVAGYADGSYVVLDPANAEEIHYASADVLTSFFNGQYGGAGVVLG